MATITTSIGDGTSHDQNVDITGTAGAGPSYTVTLAAAGTDVANGDALWDEHATPRKYLITAGAGTTSLTVFDSTGVSAAPDSSGTSTAQVKRYYNGATPIADWETDLDDTDLYANGDDAVGECYNDAAFNETVVTINGGGSVTLASRTLTVAEGERHDGTAGTGARWVSAATGRFVDVQLVDTTVEWLEVDANGNDGGAFAVVIATTFNNSTADKVFFRNLIVHDIDGGAGSNFQAGIGASSGDQGGVVVENNVIYDLDHSASSRDCHGIRFATSRSSKILNNTVHDIYHSHATDGEGYGISNFDNANHIVKNNLVTDVTNASAATAVCFNPSTDVNQDAATNASDDSTAPDPIAAEPVVAGDEYASTAGGAEDLRLKSGAECIDAGTDLGTTPTGVNISIQGRDRDAEGDTWDIGADEYVAAGGFAGSNQIIGAGILGGQGV